MSEISKIKEKLDRADIAGAISNARILLKSSFDEIQLVDCGKVLESFGLLELGRGFYEKASKVSPRSSTPHIALGALALKESENEQAILHLRNATELEQGNAAVHTLLGVAYINLGDETEAESSLRLAISIDPEYEEAYFNLGSLLRDANPNLALDYLSKAVELDPDYASAHRELGWALMRKSASPESEYHLRRAIELNPRDAWARVYLGNYFLDHNDQDSALHEFRIAAKLAPTSAFPLRAIGNVYEDRKAWREAQRIYEKALELEPDNVVVNMNMARMFKSKGDYGPAKTYAHRALLLDPDYAAAHRILSDLSSL